MSVCLFLCHHPQKIFKNLNTQCFTDLQVYPKQTFSVLSSDKIQLSIDNDHSFVGRKGVNKDQKFRTDLMLL